MESARRQTLWYLLRADTGDARRARQRLAAGTCVTLFFAGLLAAVGLGVVVVAACVLFAAAIAATAAFRALRRHRHGISTSLRSFASGTYRTLGRAASHAREHTKRAASDARQHTERAASRAREHTERAAGLLTAHAAHAAAGVRQIQLPQPRPIDRQREALKLNAAGTNLRRAGSYGDAVELHTQALGLLREVDNPQAVALTKNNLALALSHVGDDPAAISLFEQAAATLHGLGDTENEGKVMANLALAHRRHGRADESADVLRLALTRLEPKSTAYELVEAQLQRAS